MASLTLIERDTMELYVWKTKFGMGLILNVQRKLPAMYIKNNTNSILHAMK